MLERLKETITYKNRIPEYEYRAAYYRERAIRDSIAQGVLVKEGEGVDLIEGSEVSVIPYGDSGLEFALDESGICFARIKDGKYYPIDTSLSEEDLGISRYYDKLSRSAIRRWLREPYEQRSGRQLFELSRTVGGLVDTTAVLGVLVEQLNQVLQNANLGE